MLQCMRHRYSSCGTMNVAYQEEPEVLLLDALQDAEQALPGIQDVEQATPGFQDEQVSSDLRDAEQAPPEPAALVPLPQFGSS